MGRDARGQSLLETALMMPIMLMLVLNVVNLGYFIFVTVNLTAATRAAAEYAIMGPGAPGTTSYPNATGTRSVAALIYNDMTGAIQGATNSTVQICSPSILIGNSGTSGGTGGTPILANCVLCTNSTSCAAPTTGANATFVPDADPETNFVLARVDVKYTFSPLIPGRPFNIITIANLYNSSTGQYTFYRHIEMRAN